MTREQEALIRARLADVFETSEHAARHWSAAEDALDQVAFERELRSCTPRTWETP